MRKRISERCYRGQKRRKKLLKSGRAFFTALLPNVHWTLSTWKNLISETEKTNRSLALGMSSAYCCSPFSFGRLVVLGWERYLFLCEDFPSQSVVEIRGVLFAIPSRGGQSAIERRMSPQPVINGNLKILKNGETGENQRIPFLKRALNHKKIRNCKMDI